MPQNEGRKAEKAGELVSIYRRNRVWQAQYMVGRRQVRQSLRTKSRKTAQLRASKLDRDLVAGAVHPTFQEPPLNAVIEQYLAYLRVEGRTDKTIKKYEFALRIVEKLATAARIEKASELSVSFVDRFRAARKSGDEASGRRPSSPKTIHHDTVLIRQLVNYALRRGLIERDPLAGLRIPKPRRNLQPCWSQAEVEKILDATRPPYRSALTMLAETGMRVGELVWLTWDDIDFVGAWIHIRPKDGWRPKSGDHRSVPMSARARKVLLAQSRCSRWAFPRPALENSRSTTDQISPRRLLACVKRVVKRLGLSGHLHTFRHAFISNAAIAGVAPDVLRKWVGHVDQATFDLYFHLASDASQRAMSRLDEAKMSPLSKRSSTHFQHTEVTDEN